MDCRTKLLQNSDRIYNPRQQTEAILYTCFAAPYISDAELDTSTALSVPLLRNALGGFVRRVIAFAAVFRRVCYVGLELFLYANHACTQS